MKNLEKYQQVFTECFGVTSEVLSELKYQQIDNWDSIGHMTLISLLEDTFDIMIDIDDIIDFNSFEKGKDILKKYDVEF